MARIIITDKRLEELKRKKISVLDIVFAASMARIESEDLIAIHLGQEPDLEKSRELYDLGMSHLRKQAAPEDLSILEKTALANMVQASFSSYFCGVLGVEPEEMEAINRAISIIESEKEIEGSIKEKLKVMTKTSGRVN